MLSMKGAVPAPEAGDGDIVYDMGAVPNSTENMDSDGIVAHPTKMMMAQGSSVDASLPPELSLLHEDILKSLQRDINILGDVSSDRNSKRRSLEKIQKETVGRGIIRGAAGPPLDPRLATALLRDTVKPLLRCFSDSVEKCRELSLQILASFTTLVSDIVPSLPYILPVLSSRLAEPEIVEPSEEIRLQLLSCLVKLVETAKERFSPGVDEAVKILGRTLLDPYPEVKKESCKLILSLVKETPRAMSNHGTTIVKALTHSLQHRHSAVRVTSLKALQATVLADASGLDEVLDTLRALCMDKAPAVRETLYAVAEHWLRHLVDRYSLGYKILPVLFAGMTDELQKCRDACTGYLDGLGALYEKEWESRLKDELDYTMGVGDINLNPDRPRVGARHLARDNTQKIVTKLIDGLQDWNPDVRFKSAAILSVFVCYTEDNITGYTGPLLPALYKVLSSDELHVMEEAVKVGEVVGRFVSPDLYINLLLSHVKSNSDSAAFRLGCLRTLASLLRGTAPPVLSMYIATVLDAVSDREMVGNENISLLLEIANVAEVLAIKLESLMVPGLDGSGVSREKEGFRLFSVLLGLISVDGSDKIPGWLDLKLKSQSAFVHLAKSHGVEHLQQLCEVHFDALHALLMASVPMWNRFSYELRVFDALLTESGPIVGSKIGEIVKLLVLGCTPEMELEVRNSLLQTLVKLCSVQPMTPLNFAGLLHEHSSVLLRSVIIPNATWRAGRKLHVTRGLAINALLHLIQPQLSPDSLAFVGSVPASTAQELIREDSSFMPIVVACFEEDEATTRVNALRVVGTWLDGAVNAKLTFEAEMFKKLYPELIKRLDDALDDIRILACLVIRSMCGALASFHSQHPPQEDGALGYMVTPDGPYVETRLDNGHWATMVKGVLIHVDDSNQAVQDAATAAASAICHLAPRTVVQEILEGAKSRYRAVQRVEEIINSVAQA